MLGPSAFGFSVKLFNVPIVLWKLLAPYKFLHALTQWPLIIKGYLRGQLYIFPGILYPGVKYFLALLGTKDQVEIRWTVSVFKCNVCNVIFVGWDSGISSLGLVCCVPGRWRWLTVTDRPFRAMGGSAIFHTPPIGFPKEALPINKSGRVQTQALS